MERTQKAHSLAPDTPPARGEAVDAQRSVFRPVMHPREKLDVRLYSPRIHLVMLRANPMQKLVGLGAALLIILGLLHAVHVGRSDDV